MSAKPKQSHRPPVSDKRLPKASLLERLDRPTGPDLRPQLSGMESRLSIFEALQDAQAKDIAWFKTEFEKKPTVKDVADWIDQEGRPRIKALEAKSPGRIWPLWTMLIVEMAGLAALFAKVYGVDIL